MITKEAKEKLHNMRSSLGVLRGFLQNCDPRDEDEQQHLQAAQKSLDKLCDAVEELDAIFSGS